MLRIIPLVFVVFGCTKNATPQILTQTEITSISWSDGDSGRIDGQDRRRGRHRLGRIGALAYHAHAGTLGAAGF